MTLLALHQYLGLGSELIAAKHRGNKNIKARGRIIIINKIKYFISVKLTMLAFDKRDTI